MHFNNAGAFRKKSMFFFSKINTTSKKSIRVPGNPREPPWSVHVYNDVNTKRVLEIK